MDANFHGYPEFSDGSGLPLAILGLWRFHPAPFRIVITDTEVRIEGRWRFIRSLLPSRAIAPRMLLRARLRGPLVTLFLPNDEWWSISTATQAQAIAEELERRGVSITRE